MHTPDSQHEPQQMDHLCDEFEADLTQGRAKTIEMVLEQIPTTLRRTLLRELIQIELEQRVATGEPLTLQNWLDRFPDDLDLVYSGFQITEPQPDLRLDFPNPGRRLSTQMLQFFGRAMGNAKSWPLSPPGPSDPEPKGTCQDVEPPL